jgi:8-oxo-dGTP diphosphatase
LSRNRLYPERPLVGVGVLIQQQDKYLLIKRAAEPDAGLWSIPGGMVEVGERTVETAVREVLEETSLEVEIEKMIGVVDKIVPDSEGEIKYHFIIIDYLAKPVGGEMHHGDDALDARWVHPREFKEYKLTPTLVELLKRIDLYPL